MSAERCPAETFSRWPDYANYPCVKERYHLGAHASDDYDDRETTRIDWTDHHLRWDEAENDYRSTA